MGIANLRTAHTALNERIVCLKHSGKKGRNILYWMSREQRVEYNFGLLAAFHYAQKNLLPLTVAFCVAPEFLGASPEAFAFMGEGLKEVEAALKAKNIPFRLLYGHPPARIAEFAATLEAEAIFVDLDPLRLKQAWQKELFRNCDASIYEVDSRNIVPARIASGRREFAAYTIRPKIHRLLPDFLSAPPVLEVQEGSAKFYENDYSYFETLPKNSFWTGGRSRALARLREFIDKKLEGYAAFRNDPANEYQSELSPYLHFGQISSLEIVLAIKAAKASEESKAAYLEELIVRRELAENFCLYCKDYDNENCLEPWAKANMEITDREPREHIYSFEDFASARTHDELWNAAQIELKTRGKIHGYVRMYWAKKILEWTPSTKDAFKVAVSLNDRYALDGRDPNGYAGIAWSIGGVHDRAWPARKIFGKVRYMSYSGCKAKFNVNGYILKVMSLLARHSQQSMTVPTPAATNLSPKI